MSLTQFKELFLYEPFQNNHTTQCGPHHNYPPLGVPNWRLLKVVSAPVPFVTSITICPLSQTFPITFLHVINMSVHFHALALGKRTARQHSPPRAQLQNHHSADFV
jgi:hypothetical protein